jgi:hypothetical protein
MRTLEPFRYSKSVKQSFDHDLLFLLFNIDCCRKRIAKTLTQAIMWHRYVSLSVFYTNNDHYMLLLAVQLIIFISTYLS